MAFTYAVVDGFPIAFLMILFISTREKSTRLTETRCFRAIVMMTIAALIGDLIAWQLDGRPGLIVRGVLWASNILCYVFSGAMTLCWLYYTALKMNRLGHISKTGWSFITLPCVVLTVVSVLTPWTQWLFDLDSANIYQRGTLFFLQVLIPFGYALAAAIWALHQAGKERLRQQRMEYLALASFIIFPLIGSILQLVFYGVSLAGPCSALALMLVYVSMQNHMISLDALTGLNNRGQFDKHLFSCIERAGGDMHFALFMLDIDNFKTINDEYGHTAGDAALIDAAGILKRSLADTNSFLARYGGDEFAVVLYYNDEAQVDALLARIIQEADKRNRTAVTPYKLVFSVGCVCYDKKRYANYQDMITAADAHMYMQKREHKAGR